MRIINLALLTFALLLAACAPAAEAQQEAAESTTPVGNSASTLAPPNTPMPTVEATSATVPPTTTSAELSTTQVSTTEMDTAETDVADTSTATVTAAVPVVAAQSVPVGQAYENLASPVDLLASYYNAVNRQEYERAYGYWQEAPLDYDSFANGYADTASVQLIVQPPTRIEGAAGSLYVEIPTVLIAHHHDGSVHTFAGCIVTRKSNLQPPDIPEEDVWHLYQARIAEVENNADIPTLLVQGCAS